MTIRKKKYQFIAVIFLAALLLTVYFTRRNRIQGKIFVVSQAIKTGEGWGYNIVGDGKTYIHQEFIPGISGRHPFKTEGDALLVGNKVIEKISANQLPTITLNDLKILGIIKDSVVYK